MKLDFKSIIFLSCLFFMLISEASEKITDKTNDGYISLNFQDTPVRTALQFLAHCGGKDIIINDAVAGNITLHMDHVFWEEALEIILQTHGLDSRIVNHAIFVGTPEEIQSWEKNRQSTTPLEISSVVLEYAKATEMLKTITSTESLSERGHLSVDKRTNAILIQDTPEKVNNIKSLIQALDTPVRQVLIEARMVMVNRDFEKDLGIKFGVSNDNNLSGTLDGANDITGGTSPEDVPVEDRLNLDFSAVSSTGATPASIGIALAKLGGGLLLDLELSAIETEGEGKVISSPRLVTANQESAYIESGEEIPYQESTSSGATAVVFKKAVLRLKVTPEIMANDKIKMDLVINQDIPNGTLVNGVPELNTKEIQTNVLVKNGETLVLGGIYRQTKTRSRQRVPFLSDIPGIGSIFQKKADTITYEEMLIFITPKIVNEEV